MLIRNEIDWKIIVPKDVSDVLRQPAVAKINHFTEEAVIHLSDVLTSCHQMNQCVLPIVINSVGGDVYSLFSMIDLIKTSKIPVMTIVEGKAMSAAAVLAASGTRGFRYASETSTYMVHDIWNWGKENEKTEDLKVSALESDRLNKMMLGMLDTFCDKDSGYFWEKLQSIGRTDLYLDTSDASSYGFLDKIGIPTFITRVSAIQSIE